MALLSKAKRVWSPKNSQGLESSFKIQGWESSKVPLWFKSQGWESSKVPLLFKSQGWESSKVPLLHASDILAFYYPPI
jgi:hypothetical protein